MLFQGKRGIAKRPFQLPDFIAATGIEKMRQVTLLILFPLLPKRPEQADTQNLPAHRKTNLFLNVYAGIH